MRAIAAMTIGFFFTDLFYHVGLGKREGNNGSLLIW